MGKTAGMLNSICREAGEGDPFRSPSWLAHLRSKETESDYLHAALPPNKPVATLPSKEKSFPEMNSPPVPAEITLLFALQTNAIWPTETSVTG